MSFFGYERPDGRVGIRNHVLILPSVLCSSETCRQIAEQVPGCVTLSNQAGCAQVGDDVHQTRRTLIGFGNNPNVGAVLVVGLGCEGVNPHGLAQQIKKLGKPVETLVIQEVGGTVKTVEKGVQLAKRLAELTQQASRKKAGVEQLIIGIARGDADVSSLTAADPASGCAADAIVNKGGTVLFSETRDLIGAEQELAAKCPDASVKQKLLRTVEQQENKLREKGTDYRATQPGPKLIQKGITTITEKSLASAIKSGTAPIRGVLDYGQSPPDQGRYLVDSAGSDVEAVTGMIAAGAQIIVFTTGKGNPVGSPISPVIKVCGDPQMAHIMADNIDINAGSILEGKESIQEVGRHIYDDILAVADGRQTRAEALGFGEFAINRILPSF